MRAAATPGRGRRPAGVRSTSSRPLPVRTALGWARARPAPPAYLHRPPPPRPSAPPGPAPRGGAARGRGLQARGAGEVEARAGSPAGGATEGVLTAAAGARLSLAAGPRPCRGVSHRERGRERTGRQLFRAERVVRALTAARLTGQHRYALVRPLLLTSFLLGTAAWFRLEFSRSCYQPEPGLAAH